jgi:WD40 repeat protein
MLFFDFVAVTLLGAINPVVEQRPPARTEPLERLPVIALDFSPDGKYILAGRCLGGVDLWEAATGKLLVRAKLSTDSQLCAVAFSPDGRRAVTATARRDGRDEITLWEVPSLKPIKTLDRMRGCTEVSFSPDGKRFLTVGNELLRLWDTADGRLSKTFTKAGEDAVHVAFFPDGKRALVDGKEDMVILDLDQDKVVRRLPYPAKKTRIVGISRDVRFVVLSRGDDLHLLDVERGRYRLLLPGAPPPADPALVFSPLPIFHDAKFSPDGKWFVTAPGPIQVWEVKTAKMVRAFPKAESFGGEFQALALSRDGRWAASGHWEQTIKLWDVSTGRLVRTMSALRPGGQGAGKGRR